MKIVARVLVLTSAFLLAACHESVTGPESLSGSWSGSAEGRTLKLDLVITKGTGSVFGVPVETTSLRYSGFFSDATLGYSGPIDQSMGIGTEYDLHPFTLQYIADVVTDTAAYWFYYRGEQTGAREITGWLFRGTNPLTGSPLVTMDSTRLVLRRN